MKKRTILALWAVGFGLILAWRCWAQAVHPISYYPSTNQLGAANYSIWTAGNTNMKVSGSVLPGAIGVPTLGELGTATNDAYTFAKGVGSGCTGLVYAVGANTTGLVYSVGGNCTSFSYTIGANGTNFTYSIGANGTNFTYSIGANCTGLVYGVGANCTSFVYSIGANVTNYVNTASSNRVAVAPGANVTVTTNNTGSTMVFTVAASGGAATTNFAMISSGWVEAGGGHFTNDLSVDGTMRMVTLDVGSLIVTGDVKIGSIYVATNAYVAGLIVTNGATFQAGATFASAVTSSADSASNAPAANEFPNASWVRGLFNNGAILYSGPGVRTDATNDSSGQFMYLFTNTIPATGSRKYPAPNAGDYVGGVMTSNALTFVQGPIYVHAFLQSSNGSGNPSISVHPEIYYSYDRTNWQGDFSANDQVIATGTNLYEWVVSFPAITSTNNVGFWIERRFRVGAAAGATHPDLFFHLGTNFLSGTNDASHIAFSGPSSASGNAFLANDQTFTGSNTFNKTVNISTNLNTDRLTVTNRLTIGPTGSGTTLSNLTGVTTIRDSAGQTVGVIDNDATLGTPFWIISTPTSNSLNSVSNAVVTVASNLVENQTNSVTWTESVHLANPEGTNITLQSLEAEVMIGTSNVNIVAIMGAPTSPRYQCISITNGTGVTWGIAFSAVTNHWTWDYSKAAPTVLTNGTRLFIATRTKGSNVLASYAYYPWP